MLSGFDNNFNRDDEEVLNEFRQKQVNFDLEERKNEINNSRSLFIGALAGLAMAGVVGWFILAPQYKTTASEEVPVIRRPQSPSKVQPAEPGNVDISNQEKAVYDIIEKKPEEKEVETILPPPEEPNIAAIETLIEDAAGDDDTKGIVTAESLAVPAAQLKEEPVVSEAKTEPAEDVKKEETAPVVSKDLTSAEVKKDSKPSVAPKGAWQIQLMSSPNKTAVVNSWGTMVKKYPLLSGQIHEVETADLGEKGVYYRLRAGNFATKEDASQFCNKLKSAGGNCFVARK